MHNNIQKQLSCKKNIRLKFKIRHIDYRKISTFFTKIFNKASSCHMQV